MLLVADTWDLKEVMHHFLKQHGVEIPMSEDFNAIARIGIEGGIIGVVGYNGFCGNTCMMHNAGVGNWISRDFLHKAFAYPFIQLGLACVFATVAASNSRALKLDKHLGFEVLHRIRDGWQQNEDMVLLIMRYNQCRWLRPRELQHERKVA